VPLLTQVICAACNVLCPKAVAQKRHADVICRRFKMTSGTGLTDKQMKIAEAIRSREYKLLVRASCVLVVIVHWAASHAQLFLCRDFPL
jgi:hypothetical protein